MSKEYSQDILSQTSPYIPGMTTRKLKVYFSLPEDGINGETGIVLFVPGYGGNANSNVYKKCAGYSLIGII